MWIISIILMMIAGMFNSCMDVLRYRYNISIFRNWKNQNWVNPALSWPNKWKPTTKFGDLVMSTVLVWITDMWHFVKMLMILSVCFAIVFYTPIYKWWADLLILYFAFTTIFELFFSKILIKK
jgi:hypothetical protein